MDVLEEILGAFSKRQLHDGLALARTLEANKLNFEDLEIALTQEQKSITNRLANLPKCPKCGALLRPGTVNDSKGTMVGEGLKSVWRCSNWKICGYERFSRRTIEEELKALRRK